MSFTFETETPKIRNHLWLNPQLPQDHHYPNAQRRKTRRTHADARGSPTRSCSQLLFRERENKVSSARWVATYFPTPKNRGHPSQACKTKQNETHKRNIISAAHITVWEKLTQNRYIYIYIHLSIYIYINNALAKIPQTNVPSPKWSQLMKKDGSKIQVTQFQSKKFSALFLLLRRWGIHAARFRG